MTATIRHEHHDTTERKQQQCVRQERGSRTASLGKVAERKGDVLPRLIGQAGQAAMSDPGRSIDGAEVGPPLALQTGVSDRTRGAHRTAQVVHAVDRHSCARSGRRSTHVHAATHTPTQILTGIAQRTGGSRRPDNSLGALHHIAQTDTRDRVAQRAPATDMHRSRRPVRGVSRVTGRTGEPSRTLRTGSTNRSRGRGVTRHRSRRHGGRLRCAKRSNPSQRHSGNPNYRTNQKLLQETTHLDELLQTLIRVG